MLRLRPPPKRFRPVAEAMQCSAVLRLFPFVGFLQIPPCLVECAKSIVVGLNRLAIFVYRALALAGDVKNLTQLDAAPNFSPSRFAVAVERCAVGICCGLIISLQEEDISDSIVGQRTVLVDV